MAKSQANSAIRLQRFLSGTKQGQSYSVAISTIILLLAVLVFGIFPALGSTLAQASENGRRLETISDLQAKDLKLSTLQTEETSKSDIIAKFLERFPESVKEGEIINIIDNLAISNSLLVRTINFTEIEKRRAINQIYSVNPRVVAKYVTVSIDGTPEDLNNFVTDIEQQRRIFNVRNFTYRNEENRIDIGVERFNLILRAEVYFWDADTIIQ